MLWAAVRPRCLPPDSMTAARDALPWTAFLSAPRAKNPMRMPPATIFPEWRMLPENVESEPVDMGALRRCQSERIKIGESYFVERRGQTGTPAATAVIRRHGREVHNISPWWLRGGGAGL